MKVSEVIKRLEELKEELGDVEVGLYMEDIDGTQCGIDEINEIDVSTDANNGNPEIYIAYKINKED